MRRPKSPLSMPKNLSINSHSSTSGDESLKITFTDLIHLSAVQPLRMVQGPLLKTMKSVSILGVLIVALYSCASPKYITRKQSEIVKLNLDNSIINYIPLADHDLSGSKILDSSYVLIVGKKLPRLDKYLQSVEKTGINSSDLYLSKTLLAITLKDYIAAAQSLKQTNDTDYPLLKRLLSIDLNYEIAKTNGTFKYNGFLKSYQELIDSYPDDNSLKKIVAIRLRYLRYNY